MSTQQVEINGRATKRKAVKPPAPIAPYDHALRTAREIAAHVKLPPSVVEAAFSRDHQAATRERARSGWPASGIEAMASWLRRVSGRDAPFLEVAADAIVLHADAKALARARKSGADREAAKLRLYEILLRYGLNLEFEPTRPNEVWIGQWPFHSAAKCKQLCWCLATGR